jgi:NDP-sugar pyrophosphorylase family protein
VDFDLDALAERHRTTGALVTLVAAEPPAGGGSALEIARDHAVLRYGHAQPVRLVSAGVYFAARHVLEDILPPAGTSPMSLETDVLPRLAGHGLYAFETSGSFIDIGTPAEFHRAQTLLAGDYACR